MENQKIVNIGTYLAGFVAVVDQISKIWVLHQMKLHPEGEVLTPFLNIVLSMNHGVTFGIMNEYRSFTPFLFTGIAVVILVFLLGWLRKASTVLVATALGLVMGGAVGNVADRLRLGAVVDFIDFHVAGYHWYVFNLADSAIVCGVGLLLLDHLASIREKE